MRDGKNRVVAIETGLWVDARLARVPWVLTIADENGRNRYVASHHETYESARQAQTRWVEGSR